MDATKPIHLQILELKQMWREVWWAMAEGKQSEYEKIKQTVVFEYWGIFDLWRDRVEKEKEILRQKSTQHGR